MLGLISPEHIFDAFEEHHAELMADPEDADEYRALNIFWVASEARWDKLKDEARQPIIGQIVDKATIVKTLQGEHSSDWNCR